MRPRLVACLLAATVALPAAAEEALSPSGEALLLLRVLAYDRQVTARAVDAVTVALASLPDDRAGQARRAAVAAALDRAALQFTVAGLPVRWVAVSASGEGLAEELRLVRASAVLVLGQAAGDPAALCRAARAARVLSLAGSREAVERCVSVGLVLRGARAGVLVNLASAQAEGADLEPALLTMAEVLAPAPPR
ncbi:MAG: DUF4154 domain-containing protein [Anaeromyxobacter sp.]|nr:DUF4154 domain-containing protein [Anaeromyxobacter sp.]MBL0275608.1 DUF4154 domain-containing protein [Anaeromyxobacter sp.]